ncbi:MAG: HupE/UreJ family protein [Rubrivivax sp.]|nr:HupE/UreJ family protein [Rubrivivax sp.]
MRRNNAFGHRGRRPSAAPCTALHAALHAVRSIAAWALLLMLAAPPPSAAHDIPTDVRVLAFVKPEGEQLLLLVRVPLAALNEVDMPLRGPGYLDLARADGALRTAAQLWLADNLTAFESGQPLPRPQVLATRVSLASDRSFASWGEAMAHLRAPPIPVATDLPWKAQHFDVLLAFPVRSSTGLFALEPRLARMGLRVVTALRFLPPGGAERAFEWHGNPGLVVLDPRWHQAALRFVREGFVHILEGTDHLLFIACLAIPLRRWRPLLVVATAFTVAHSLTLAAAALGVAPQGLWFPPLVEWAIAASIVAMALLNMLGGAAHHRWMLAFAFGLVHGFGFAFALRESLQFAGAHLATALLAFNVGVELGQIAVLLVAVPLLALAMRHLSERAAVIVASAVVAHMAWHWMSERWAALVQFPWPAPDAAAAAELLRWAMAALVLALVVWAADRPLRRWMRAE